MLEVRREAAVARDRRPTVFLELDLRAADVHHRLDGEHHALAQPNAAIGLSEVGHLRILMQALADAVSDEIADDGVVTTLRVRLDPRRDPAKPPARLDP